jgi:hypothetical protein
VLVHITDTVSHTYTTGKMPANFVHSAVWAHHIPEPVRALSSLSNIQYADQFTLSTQVDATPEQWVRAMFGDVPSITALLIWKGVLGFRLSQVRSPETVAGWRIDENHKDRIRLETSSWFLSANIVVQVADGQVSSGTFLKYERRIAYVVWPVASVLHRLLVPWLLRGAATRIHAQK